MPELPPFPVDPGTLDAIEEAIGQTVTDERAAATRESAGAPHGTKPPITEGEVDADPNLDDLLEHLSGYVEGAGVEGEPQSGIVMHSIPTVYNRDDVILALIQEVRALRRPEPEHDSPTGQCSDNCPACFGVNPGVAADEVRARADRIIAHGDPEWQHHQEDELLYDLVKTYAPPAVYAEVTRLADADFDRWYA